MRDHVKTLEEYLVALKPLLKDASPEFDLHKRRQAAIRAVLEENKQLKVEVDSQADRILKLSVLDQRIEAALALHKPLDSAEPLLDQECDECSFTVGIAWPCSTVKALRGEK